MPESKGRPHKRAVAPPSTRAARPVGPNPTWWAPVMVTLMVLGLIWVVVFYVTSGAWPVAAFGYWNLVSGFVLMLAGFAMTMRWR